MPAINVPRNTRPLDLIAALLARLAQGSYSAGLNAQFQLAAAPTWLTLPEASQHSGLSIAFLRRLIIARKLPAVRDRSIKVRRVDLDNLDGLSELSASSRKMVSVADELRAAMCSRRRK